MKMLYSLIVIMILRQVIAGVVRKPPAFFTPIYSNAYLPAAMQVIFHAVEQLKMLQEEEISSTELAISSSILTNQSMKTQQSQSITSEGIFIISTSTTAKVLDEKTEIPIILTSTSKIANQASSKIHDDLIENASLIISTASVVSDNYHDEIPEVNEETTEKNYESPATPETNYESPESGEEIETTKKISKENEQTSESIDKAFEISRHDDASTQPSITQILNNQKTKEPTVDSIVDEIHKIVKTTTSFFKDEFNDEKSVETAIEKSEKKEEENEETRFCLLGERVTQVPRPSLNYYLRRSKVPPRPSLQQLANLYDAFSKDARKQGLARFAGYTDEVLKILYSSAEGGIGPQLKQLLEKIVERNELTRDDAKMKTSQALRDLDNPASALSKDLRSLLPLRYTP